MGNEMDPLWRRKKKKKEEDKMFHPLDFLGVLRKEHSCFQPNENEKSPQY